MDIFHFYDVTGSFTEKFSNYDIDTITEKVAKNFKNFAARDGITDNNTNDDNYITWNFETGDLKGWTVEGKTFVNQPTYGDNPTARNRGQPSNHQGNYWIGGFENYKGPGSGNPGDWQGDGLTGSLTTLPFIINGNKISFLIGGGQDPEKLTVNLVVDGVAVLSTTGKYLMYCLLKSNQRL